MSAATRSLDRTTLSAVVLALGVALAGWFMGHGFLRGRMASRYVEVEGLAEREVAWQSGIRVPPSKTGRR